MEGKGWVEAEDLQVGDDIRNAGGETGKVESITTEETSQEMYNLTVDEAHTFFVGDGQWLVHNADLCPTRWADSDLWQRAKRNATPTGESLAYELVEGSRYRDMETHVTSVMHFSAGYAKHLGFSNREIINLSRGVGLHDIGKGFSNLAPYFNNPGPFVPIMRTHASRGASLLDWLGVDREIVNVARWHHPKYAFDGVNMPYWNDIGYLTQAMVPADTLSASMFPVYTHKATNYLKLMRSNKV